MTDWRWYITFGGVDYDLFTDRVLRTAPGFGVNAVRVYDDAWLVKHPFYKLNHWLWETPIKRGFGWHAWKPLILLDALDTLLRDGEVVLYVDADTYPLRDLGPIYDTARRDGVMLFDCSGRKQSDWCTEDCCWAMGLAMPSEAGCARFVAVRKGSWRARQLLMEWLTYCVNPRCNARDHIPASFPNHLGFMEHRTDQAILTNLAHRYGYTLHPEASQGGPNAPQFFEQVHCTTGTNMAGHNPGQGSRFRNVEMPRCSD